MRLLLATLIFILFSCSTYHQRDLANTFDLNLIEKVYNQSNQSFYYVKDGMLLRYSLKYKKEYLIKSVDYNISKVFLLEDAKEPVLALWAEAKQVGIGSIKRNKFYQTQAFVPSVANLELELVHKYQNKMIFYYEEPITEQNKVGFKYKSELSSDKKLNYRTKGIGFNPIDPKPGQIRAKLGFKEGREVIKLSRAEYKEILADFYYENRNFPRNLEIYTFDNDLKAWQFDSSFDYFNNFDASTDLEKLVFINRDEKMVMLLEGNNYKAFDSKFSGNFVEMSPDQNFFAVASADEKVVAIYDIVKTKKLYQLNFDDTIRSLSYLPNGNLIVVLVNGDIMEANPAMKGQKRIYKIASFDKKLTRDIQFEIDRNLNASAIAEDGSKETVKLGKKCSLLLR